MFSGDVQSFFFLGGGEVVVAAGVCVSDHAQLLQWMENKAPKMGMLGNAAATTGEIRLA